MSDTKRVLVTGAGLLSLAQQLMPKADLASQQILAQSELIHELMVPYRAAPEPPKHHRGKHDDVTGYFQRKRR